MEEKPKQGRQKVCNPKEAPIQRTATGFLPCFNPNTTGLFIWKLIQILKTVKKKLFATKSSVPMIFFSFLTQLALTGKISGVPFISQETETVREGVIS